MSFTTGKIVKIYPQRVYVIDGYDRRHVIYMDQINVDDRECLSLGSNVIIHENGDVELASSSFNRWRDEQELEELALATEVTHADYTE